MAVAPEPGKKIIKIVDWVGQGMCPGRGGQCRPDLLRPCRLQGNLQLPFLLITLPPSPPPTPGCIWELLAPKKGVAAFLCLSLSSHIYLPANPQPRVFFSVDLQGE